MIHKLVTYIQQKDGIGDKQELSRLVAKEFSLSKNRSVYYNDNFAIRFSKSNTPSPGNTVLSLSALKKYDDNPFFVCVCTPVKNYLFLANTTFLSKISHSSKLLTMENIKGSFNGSDIIREINGVANVPENFETLFELHQDVAFEENLVRLVEATNGIVPTKIKFDVSTGNRMATILDAPSRVASFVGTSDYNKLLFELNQRVQRVEKEILEAASNPNVNLRGRIIEYLIAGEDDIMRKKVIDSILHKAPFPKMITKDGLGDYTVRNPEFHVEVDIKSKLMHLNSAPKGYNVDKMLEFLSDDSSVFMMFFVGIDQESKTVTTKLVSIFEHDLLEATNIQTHWAGRNSRGVTQFYGEAIKRVIQRNDDISIINEEKAKSFLLNLIQQ